MCCQKSGQQLPLGRRWYVGEHRRGFSRAGYRGVFDLYEFIKLFICDMYTLLYLCHPSVTVYKMNRNRKYSRQ